MLQKCIGGDWRPVGLVNIAAGELAVTVLPATADWSPLPVATVTQPTPRAHCDVTASRTPVPRQIFLESSVSPTARLMNHFVGLNGK